MKSARYITTAVIGILVLAATSYGQPERGKSSGDGDKGAEKRFRPTDKKDGMMREGGGRGGMQGGPKGGMDRGGSIIERIIESERLCKELNITDEQKAELSKQAEEHKANAEGIEGKLRAAAEEQAELMKAEEIDQEAVIAKIDEIGGYRTELAKLKVQQLFTMQDGLTDEQLATMKEKREQHEQHRQEMMERMRERRGGEEGERPSREEMMERMRERKGGEEGGDRERESKRSKHQDQSRERKRDQEDTDKDEE